MSEQPRHVSFYLHEQLLQRVKAGKHNFLAKLNEVLQRHEFTVDYHDDEFATLLAARDKPGYSVVLMEEPVNAHGVTIRLNYLYPFWHIERTAKRWEWPVAQAEFAAQDVFADEADRFCSFRRKALFGATPVPKARPDGFVYVPLQGQLLRQRSFQACSPIDMIRAVIAHVPDRDIVVTLHPKETYLAPERAALDELISAHPRLSLRQAEMRDLLPECSFVVTQNSSAALHGYFVHKPAVLFGRCNFHHIAADVHKLGIPAAFAAVTAEKPEFDKYLWWFFHKMSINAAGFDVYAQITARLQRAGWPL